jgi:hypothetical protein
VQLCVIGTLPLPLQLPAHTLQVTLQLIHLGLEIGNKGTIRELRKQQHEATTTGVAVRVGRWSVEIGNKGRQSGSWGYNSIKLRRRG